jgi:hypothetical protein
METTEAIIRLALIGAMILLLVGGLIAILMLWYFRGRDPRTGLVADILSEPPDDLPPGAVGTLLDEHADHEDIVATLLGLGRNGALTIEAAQTPGGKGRDYLITLLHPERITNRIERDLLHVLFGPNPQAMMEVHLNQVRSRFVDSQAKMRDDLYAELVEHGYFRKSPVGTRERWRTVATIGCALSFAVGLVLAMYVDPVALAPMLAGMIVWGVMIRMSRHMPRKTLAGAEAAAKWRAFKRYLQSIHQERDLREASDIFDRYFSYAVAMRIDRQWIREFSEAGAAKPAWFGGADIGDVVVIGDIGHVGGDIGSFAGAGDAIGGLAGSVGNLSVPDVSMPDMQGMSDLLGGSLQGASDGLSGLLDAAGSIFDGIDFDL